MIGVGGMGAAHAVYCAEMEETQLVAVADASGAAAERVARETGAEPYREYSRLLARGDLDFVIIATPHPLHRAITIEAASCGLHVLCEKPLALSVSAAAEMTQSCRDNGVLLGTVFQQRTEASRRALKRLLDERVLGAVHRVSMSVTYYRPQAYYDAAAWRGTWSGEGGGVLMNQGAHALDQLIWMAGLPRRVQAMTLTRAHDIEVENTALALLDYGDGKAGWLHASTAEMPSGERLEIVGDGGLLLWEDGYLRHFEAEQPMSLHLPRAASMYDEPGGAWRNVAIERAPESHREIIRAFARAVRQGDASLMLAGAEDGLRSLELANAILLSGHCRQQVELPLDRDRYEKFLRTRQNATR